jgi:hypothetical protein
MSREQIQALMAAARAAGDNSRFFFLNEFLLDKLSSRELLAHNRAHRLAAYLLDLFNADGNAQCTYLSDVAAETVMKVTEGMPRVGPAHLVN